MPVCVSGDRRRNVACVMGCAEVHGLPARQIKSGWFPAGDVHCQQQLVESLCLLNLHAIDKSSDQTAPSRARIPARVLTRRVARQMGSEVGFVDEYIQSYRQLANESVDDFMSRLKLQTFRFHLRDDGEINECVLEQFIAGRHQTQGQCQKHSLTFTSEQAIAIGRIFKAPIAHS